MVAPGHFRDVAFPLAAIFVTATLACQTAHKADPAHDQPTAFSTADWQGVLERAVTSDGYVKFEVLQKNAGGTRDALSRFVDQIARVSPDNYPELFTTEN